MLEQLTAPKGWTPRPDFAAAVVFVLLVILGGTAGTGRAAQGGDGCAAAKVVAASQRVASKVDCYATALKKGVAVNAGCFAQANEKFTVAFASVEAKGGCTVTGDADSIGSDVDDCVATLVADEPIAP